MLLALFLAAAEPTAAELVSRYDQLMSPSTFQSTMEMVAHREDGSERTYRMTALKGGVDKLRIKFDEPASARGQEMLRVGDNNWVYMPNLKRAIRLANRDSFMGGDFNNADVLRVNYTQDFEAAFAESSDPAIWRLELKARTQSAPYDHIRLFVNKSDRMPVRAEYYAQSGKLLRSATFSDVKDFGGGAKRPANILMKNELATSRWSALKTLSLKLDVKPPATKFVLDDLGR